MNRPTIAAGIEALQGRWPDLVSPSRDSPVFVLAAGWRSGATLLQRLLVPRCFVWGEPYGHGRLIDSLADPLRSFTADWPQPEFLYVGQDQAALGGQFIAKLYLSPARLFDAHLQFFETLFAAPARKAGAANWGLKGVRLTADHASYLKWLFPQAKLLFLHRNPYDAYRSYAARREAGWQWSHSRPDRPLTARLFGEHWRQTLDGFLKETERLGALVVKYEDLRLGDFDALEHYLGYELARDAASMNPHDGGPEALDAMGEQDAILLKREVGELASRLGYEAPLISAPPSPAAAPPGNPAKCVVLVPVGGHIEPGCDAALRQLEALGYAVRRVGGYAAIDQARNQMATDALTDGFEELMWIDSDVVFQAEDVERLRSHGLPIVCGIYPKKGVRALSCHVLPGTKEVLFGEGGGLMEVLYAATGFLLVRREVFLDIERQHELPLCNEKFGKPMRPFFLPLVRDEPAGPWYLAEDYAFSQRARDCGYRIWADTTIRLRHIGAYAFGWEDSGLQLQRFATFKLQLNGDGPTKRQRPEELVEEESRNLSSCRDDRPRLAELAGAYPWPSERPSLPPNGHGWLSASSRELLTSVLNDRTLLVLDLGSWLGLSTRFIADRAPQAWIIAVDHWQGGPDYCSKPEIRRLLPTLYETFLTNCWQLRSRLIPLKMTVGDALEEISRRGLAPDVVFLDAGHAYESVKANLTRIRSLFPNTIIVGGEWNQEGVQRAATEVIRDQGGRIGVHGEAWRIFHRPTPNGPERDVPQGYSRRGACD